MIHKPNAQHLAYRKALEQAVGDHGKALDAVELLAITAHMVGQLIALQDQRLYTSAQMLELVGKNIEQGNKEVLDGLLNTEGKMQ